jgi:hypothetical protein
MANGTCGGGTSYTCDSGIHTLCQTISCGGATYMCTNAGGTWQWRTGNACDDSNVCTAGEYCSGGSCTGGSAANMCWDGICNCGETSATCPGDCPVSTGDTCANPRVISGSGTYFGDNTLLTNDYQPGSPSCTGFISAAGPDEVWSVYLTAGQQITAAMNPTSYYDAALYLVTNCSDIPGTCVAGADAGNPETIVYTATASGTYYLIADGYSTSSYGPYSLTVTIGSSGCTYPGPWTFDSSVDGWSLTGNWLYCDGVTYCYNDPWADANLMFYWSPQLTGYDYSATSPSFSLAGCSAASLGFGFMFDDYSGDSANAFFAECFNGSAWQTVYGWYESSGAVATTTVTASLSACLGATNAQIRFRATGNDTWQINGWHVNDVYVY